jgi:hypothetical protein
VDWELELTGGLLRDEGQRAGVLLLAAFLVTFLFIRTSARLMRSPRVPWWPGSVQTASGLHIHHLVFGVGLVLASGCLGLLFSPASPWRDVLAVVFGIGAGLILDEFALLLYLRDVYWRAEGRTSLDAVVIATLLTAMAVLGVAPLDLADTTGSILVVAGVALVILAIAAVALLKGRIVLGLLGLFLPWLAAVGALRLARPTSPWARWRYRGDAGKLARATARAARVQRRRLAWMDRIGGAPTPPEPAAAELDAAAPVPRRDSG